MAHKRGFTLIEVIISTALLAIITLGFLQMTVGYGSVFKKGTDADQATNDLMSAIEAGTAQAEKSNVQILDLGGGNTIKVG